MTQTQLNRNGTLEALGKTAVYAPVGFAVGGGAGALLATVAFPKGDAKSFLISALVSTIVGCLTGTVVGIKCAGSAANNVELEQQAAINDDLAKSVAVI